MIAPTAPAAGQIARQLTGRDYISYSALALYQSCPLRFYFRYVAGLPERTISSSLVMGSAVHRAVEHHFSELLAGSDPPSLEALLGQYDAAWGEYESQTIRCGKDGSPEELRGLAKRMLTAFQASELARPEGMILGVEEELRGGVIPGCPDLLGRLDLVVETSQELVVTDLKTARSRWSREQVEDSAGQLLLYHELVRSLAPGKRVRLQFAVLTKGAAPVVDLHQVPVDERRLARTKRLASRVWRAIEGQHFYPAPSPLQCPSCPFRVPCQAWQG